MRPGAVAKVGYLAGALLVATTACTSEPDRDPAVAGVIQHVDRSDRVLRLELDTGRIAEVDLDEAIALEGSRGGLDRGDLFLAGELDGQPWYFGLTERRRTGCFLLTSLARDAGTHIVFDNGLRLAKSPDFRADVDEGERYPPDGVDGQTRFCVNSRGMVTEVTPQPEST
jgi:hypothetical protein